METRIFRRTGAKITFITMGGCGLGSVGQNEVTIISRVILNRHFVKKIVKS